jgi:glycerol-3-phosphate dehydrogenase (NAD(P)+)
MTHSPCKIAIIGAGSWSLALSIVAADAGHDVHVWSRRPDAAKNLEKTQTFAKLPGVTLPNSINFTPHIQDLKGYDWLILGVGTQDTLSVLDTLKKTEVFDPHKPIVLISKGIHKETGQLLHTSIQQRHGENLSIAYIAGPNFAQGVAHRQPVTIFNVFATQPQYAINLETILTTTYFVPYKPHPNPTDLAGALFLGATKNILAIGAGLLHNHGHNTSAAFVLTGLNRLYALGHKLYGLQQTTWAGPAGLGDALLTCYGPLSRNRQFGQLRANGLSVDQAFQQIGSVVEGYHTIQTLDLPDPFFTTLKAVIQGDASNQDLLPFLSKGH